MRTRRFFRELARLCALVQRTVGKRKAQGGLITSSALVVRGPDCQCDSLMAAQCDHDLASYPHGLFLPEALERALLAGLSTLP
jgi:hypothetical protein